MGTGRYAPAFRILVVVSCAPLLWLLLVWIAWIPNARPLRVEVRATTAGTLTLSRDLGRYFYPGDAAQRAVSAGTATYEFALPSEARAIRLRLQTASGSIGRVSLGAGAQAAVLAAGARAATPRTITIDPLPQVERVPAWLASLCAAVALALIVAALGRRGQNRISAAARRLSQPETQASLTGTLVTGSLFAALLLALRVCADACHVLYGPIDNPPYWPISIFDPRTPSLGAIAATALLFVAGLAAIRLLAPARAGALPITIGLVLATLVAGNALAGWHVGFVAPTAGEMMYLGDALSISSAREFLATFGEHQRSLQIHGRTHPPGAELLYYVLFNVLGDAGAISLVLGVASMLFALACVYAILRERCGRDAAVLGALCFGLVPAVQVYFIASLDAVVCASVAGAVYCFLHRAPAVRVFGSAVFLALTMFLSFGALFLGCALLGFDLLARRSARSALRCLGAAGTAYVVLYATTGFNWLRSLLITARLENRAGFALLHDPGTYLFTRLEGVAELALFAGPMLLMLWARSLTIHEGETAASGELKLLSRVALLTLGAMLLAGMWKTGETARACVFFYPFIVLPVAASTAAPAALSPHVQRVLVVALLGQTLLMQLFGDYSW